MALLYHVSVYTCMPLSWTVVAKHPGEDNVIQFMGLTGIWGVHSVKRSN